MNLGGKSTEEIFVTSAAFLILSAPEGDPLQHYLACLDQRIDLPDGRHTKPDLLIEKHIIEYDGAYFHLDKGEEDARKTLATAALGYTVTRYRDGRLLPVEGATNFAVDASEGLESLAMQVTAHHGVTMDRQLWLRIDSLARRAILHCKQKYATTKQTAMTQYTV
ncbi:hypothetical protein JKP88DRAFT_272828 [Tribonema minus]|uniref:Uncharacterized protein n=1 Tax=Tribonema minus TaxID=303371 RepID=A0A836CF37_9STRA|nr:hypothetical protein JKP88DRAFT_272828 [Tribonema minus]